MDTCSCNVAAQFPGLGGYGIISANLRSNTQIIITSEQKILIGPSIAELSITGYGDYEVFNCPGRAGVSYEWIQKYDCMSDKTYFVPKGGDKAYKEGSVTSKILMTDVISSKGFSASASSGPHTVYLQSSHSDGYDFFYSGGPIPVSGRNTSAGIVNSLLSKGDAYLTNFSWQQDPPNIPTVSYSFMFAGKKD